MMFKKFRLAVLLSAFAAAGAGAQSLDAGVSRAQVNADLAAWQQSGLDKLSRGEGGADTTSPEYRRAYESYLQRTQGSGYRQPTSLTREQVRADLKLWQRAGLDKLELREGGADTFSAQYRAAYDNYLRMRDGEKYQKPAALTRDQVRADLALWKRAGLDRFSAGEQSADTQSPAYRVAFQSYLQLRQN